MPEINDYAIGDIAVGLKHSFERAITSAMMESFRTMTGDINPLHRDDAFAKAGGFDKSVVFGMLTASFYSTLVGVYLPGKRALFQSIEIAFNRPVYADQTLTIIGEVIEVHEVLKVVTIKATIKNQRGETVSKARIRVGVRPG